MQDELREKLAAESAVRARADENQRAAHENENELIAEAWRGKIPPSEIAKITGRSPAHIRNLRPADVPPLRTGGWPAKKIKRGKK